MDTVPTSDDADSDRIRSIASGDADQLTWLVDWLSPMMVVWARGHVGAGFDGTDVADLVQDVWVRILPKLTELRPHPSSDRMTPALVGLVRQTLRNRVLDVRRAATRRRAQRLAANSSSTFVPAASGSGPMTRAMRSERGELVREALEKMTERERSLFVGRIFEEKTIDELAAEHGMTAAAVVKARQRAKHRLVQILGAQLLQQLDPE